MGTIVTPLSTNIPKSAAVPLTTQCSSKDELDNLHLKTAVSYSFTVMLLGCSRNVSEKNQQ